MASITSLSLSFSRLARLQTLAAAHIFTFFPDANAHKCQSTFTITLTYLAKS